MFSLIRIFLGDMASDYTRGALLFNLARSEISLLNNSIYFFALWKGTVIILWPTINPIKSKIARMICDAPEFTTLLTMKLLIMDDMITGIEAQNTLLSQKVGKVEKT